MKYGRWIEGVHDTRHEDWVGNVSVCLGKTEGKVELRPWQWECTEEGWSEREDWEILVDEK